MRNLWKCSRFSLPSWNSEITPTSKNSTPVENYSTTVSWAGRFYFHFHLHFHFHFFFTASNWVFISLLFPFLPPVQILLSLLFPCLLLFSNQVFLFLCYLYSTTLFWVGRFYFHFHFISHISVFLSLEEIFLIHCFLYSATIFLLDLTFSTKTTQPATS